jgi:hypothetical protein
MGKIYSALQRSGNVFSEKNITKRTLNENSLTASEKRTLRRAGRKYEQKDASGKASSQDLQIPSLKKIDSRLMDLGLSKAQISQQSIKELNQSLNQIDGYIARPESFLKQKFLGIVNSETDFKLTILPILLERRMLVLETYDELVGRMKKYALGRLIKGISDTNVKSSIEKIFNDLQIKDSVLRKEYQKIEKSRLSIYSEQQKFSSIFKELTEKRNKTSEYFQSSEFMTTLIMGILLILTISLIAIAPFVKIKVPDILNKTFFIILGFFFGQGIGRLASLREAKENE